MLRIVTTTHPSRTTPLAAAVLLLAACGGGGGGGTANNQSGDRALGMQNGEFSTYAQDKSKGTFLNSFGAGDLPRAFDLRDRGFVPAPGDQGQQPSCVGWASAFGMKSIQESAEEQWRPDDPARQFSPAFVYNQIKQPGGGSLPKDAVELMVKKGCATLATMPYSDRDDSAIPTNAALEEAAKYRAKRSVQVQGNEASIKAAIASGGPVVIGAMLYAPFMRLSGPDARYGPEQITGEYQGGHAMCLIGWNDDKGAFLTLNSWGEQWGDRGTCWIDYRLLSTPFPLKPEWMIVSQLYTVEDMPNAGREQQEFPTALSASTDDPNFVTLRWTGAKNVQGYRVQRSEDGSAWIDVVANTRETSANDAPADFRTYRYRVLGIKGVDRETGREDLTQPSNETEGRRSQGGGGNAPANVQATTDLPLTVLVRWDATPGAERYLVVRSENANTGPYDIVDYLAGTATQDLPPVQGRVFHYRVAAVFPQGVGSFSAAVEGGTSSQAPLDLSADDMLYPFDPSTFAPADMVPGRDYVWPFWVVTNWSQQSIATDRHVVLVGLFRPTPQGIEAHVVQAYAIDHGAGFAADTTVVAEDLPFRYSGRDFGDQAIPRGNYYWFVGAYLLDEQGRIVEDAEQSDNEFYLLDRVRVYDTGR